MGQQQLLLLVLGIVIVGLAVVGGIDAFAENSEKAEYDIMTAESIEIATEMMAWKMTPKALGGGRRAEHLTGLTLAGMGYTQTGANAVASWHSGTDFIRWIVRPETSRPYVQIRSRRTTDLMVQTAVYGRGPDCIVSRRLRYNGTRWVPDGTRMGPRDAPSNCTVW